MPFQQFGTPFRMEAFVESSASKTTECFLEVTSAPICIYMSSSAVFAIR